MYKNRHGQQYHQQQQQQRHPINNVNGNNGVYTIGSGMGGYVSL